MHTLLIKNLIYYLLILVILAFPSGVIVPILTTRLCPDKFLCSIACPFPPVPSKLALPQPKTPQIKQSHKLFDKSHFAQCFKAINILY